VQNYSVQTVRNRLVHIGFFIQGCNVRRLSEPIEVTRPVLERYQRHLFHNRKKNEEPLIFRLQHLVSGAAARMVRMDDPAEPLPA